MDGAFEGAKDNEYGVKLLTSGVNAPRTSANICMRI